MVKLFLTLIGLLYLALAFWCASDPATTSKKVGFELLGGSGRSEFLTVYGGLEFGMALVFLLPWFHPECLSFSLLACFLIHASLVLFRTVGFFSFGDIEPMTYYLATGEWVIAVLSGLLVFVWPGK